MLVKSGKLRAELLETSKLLLCSFLLDPKVSDWFDFIVNF